MAKRHTDALAIQDACNPSGIAHALIEACREMRAEPDFTGTDQLRRDPAIRMIVHQLSFLCGTGGLSMDDYLACAKACEEAIAPA